MAVGYVMLGAAAAAGAQSLDMTFDPGANGVVLALLVQSNGKILVGGGFSGLGDIVSSPVNRRGIGRLNADGTLDMGFNPGSDGTVYALAEQPDGKIIVGGSFSKLGGGGTGTAPRNNIGRLNADGSLDSSFNPGVAIGTHDVTAVWALAVQPDGKILVAGDFTKMGGGTGTTTRNYLGRLNADGSLDTTFDPGPSWVIHALVLQPDGKILVGGLFQAFGYTALGSDILTPRLHIARLNPDGSLDPAFNPGADNDIAAIALQADGKIVVGGSISMLGGGDSGTTPRAYLGRLNANGSLDAGFNPGANSHVDTLAVQADGRIVVGGAFYLLGGGGGGTTPRSQLGRLNADGSIDTSFDEGANSFVRALAVQADGRILVGGTFTMLGGAGFGTTPRSMIGRIYGQPTAPSIDLHPATQSVGVGATVVFAAQAGGSPAPTVRWQVSTNAGSTWSDIGGATLTTYSFTAALGDSLRQYRAVFTNTSGSATTNAATLTVTGAPCTYTLTPTSSSSSFAGGAASVAVATQTGCAWTATSGDPFLTITSGAAGVGSDTVAYTVTRNPRRTARAGSLAIAGGTATITQAGRPAPFNFSGDAAADLAAFEPGSGMWTVTGLVDQSLGQAGDIPVPGDYDGNGVTERAVFRPSAGLWIDEDGTSVQWGLPGDIPVPGDYDGDGVTDRAIVRTRDGLVATWYVQGQAPFPFGLRSDSPVPADFDGDGKTDPAVFRPATGTWLVLESSNGYAMKTSHWGLPGDVPVPGDFDGDGKADLAVFRPSNGTWYLNLSTAAQRTVALGVAGDVPLALDLDNDGTDELVVYRPASATWWTVNLKTVVSGSRTLGAPGDLPAVARPARPASVPADRDGDATTDIAIYRPSSGEWFTRPSTTGFAPGSAVQWGLPGDLPVPGDYDGDRLADPSVYRPSNGLWYLRLSRAGFTTFRVEQWGVSGDVPVPADYDGDGRTDLAIYRPSTGEWWMRLSASDYTTYAMRQWGLPGDVPMPADYDGDGRADLAIFRPSTGEWYIRTAAGAVIVGQWGLSGDIPLRGDFDGDGRADLAVYRPATGTWYILDRFANTFVAVQWGLPSDTPVPGDYDGDGLTDLAVYRPSTGEWYIIRSTTGTLLYRQWGLPGDLPMR